MDSKHHFVDFSHSFYLIEFRGWTERWKKLPTFRRAGPTPRDMDKKFFSRTEVLFLGANGSLLSSKTKLFEIWFQRFFFFLVN